MKLKTRLFKLFAFTIFLTFIVWVVSYRTNQLPLQSRAGEGGSMVTANDNIIPDMDTSLPYDSTRLKITMSSSKSALVIDPNSERQKRRIAKILARLQADSTRLSKQLTIEDTIRRH